MVAVRREDKSLMGVGRAAEEIAHDPAKESSLLRPLRDGLFADPEATRLMIDHALHLTCGNHIIKPRVLIGVPFTATEEGISRLTPDRAISAEDLAEELRSYEGNIYITGDGYDAAHKLLCPLGVKLATTPYLIRSQNAVSIARVAERMYAEGLCVSERELAPTYLRLPQAERERLERENKI